MKKIIKIKQKQQQQIQLVDEHSHLDCICIQCSISHSFIKYVQKIKKKQKTVTRGLRY